MWQSEQVQKIDIVPVREAFPHEAHNFTLWLEQNIDALAERISLSLTVLEREKAVGSFNVDLLCEDFAGRPVIVENQLERSDHDHLGKLLTYLVNLDAHTAIWVTPEPRPEHKRVIDWLNEFAGSEFAFYLVKVEAIRIGASPYAPLFTVLVAPDDQTREIGESKKDMADLHQTRFEFWSQLLEEAKRVGLHSFSNISPSRYQYIASGAGRSGLSFNFSVGKDWANIELYIDHDRESGHLNKIIFDALSTERDDIEQEFGGRLNWYRLDDKRACRITTVFEGGYGSPEVWSSLHTEMVKAMSRLENVLRPRLARLEI